MNNIYNWIRNRMKVLYVWDYTLNALITNSEGGDEMGGQMAVGAFQTACEASPNKQQIDMWLNEGKSNLWISRELQSRFNEKISDKAVGKYRKYRDNMIQQQLEQDPNFQKKMDYANQQLIDGISKMRTVNVIDHLADTIEQCAGMLEDAKFNDIQIRNAQDMRFVSMTMLDAIKLYGDTMLKMQRFNEVDKDPSLLKPQTINVNIRGALTDILKGAMADGENGGYALIDKLRAGINGKPVEIIDYQDAEDVHEVDDSTDMSADVIEYSSKKDGEN